MILKRIGTLAIFALAACASQPQAPGLTPGVTMTQVSEVMPVRNGLLTTGLPVEFEIEITNPFDHPVTLTSVEVDTVGVSGAYSMKRVRHTFARDIPPHGSDAFQIRAWVQPLQLNDSGQASGPVTLRGTARFRSPKGVMQTAFVSRVQ